MIAAYRPTHVGGRVDSSTQSTKVLVVDAASGAVLREGRAAHPDSTEIDPEHSWQAMLAASSGGLLEGVEAIGVAGQQHGMVALDDTGNVVRQALLWNDTRSADSADDLVGELGGGAAWADAVGSVPWPPSRSPSCAGWLNTNRSMRVGQPRCSFRMTG